LLSLVAWWGSGANDVAHLDLPVDCRLSTDDVCECVMTHDTPLTVHVK
jgi:hypothetical protein